MSGVISAVAAHFQTFARQQADYASADVIRSAEPVPTAQFEGSQHWQRLEIRDVTFHHARLQTVQPTLHQIALQLKRGKRYALVGGSGAGKSTLLRVLAGLYRCEQINIKCESDDALLSGEQATQFLKAHSTLIPQDAEVFEGTLAENLSLCDALSGLPSPGLYPRALQLARVIDFIELSRAGLDAQVAERGANWSGGQRARVALARGILAAQGSSLLLLDEPTASLDSKTEAEVYDNLFSAFSDACIVSSIHRLHLLERFDEILVMHEGRLVAQGPLRTLVTRCPEFVRLLAASQQHGSLTPAPEQIAVA